jgi:Protein of unknown function (DUF2393)
MGGLSQPSPLAEQRESHLVPILLGVAFVLIVVGVIAVLSRSSPRPIAPPNPYAAKVDLSDVKMSAAENFVGARITYIEGTVTNTGDKTVTHATVHVAFKNSLGEVAQADDVVLYILKTGGPYPDTVDLHVSPLAPGQSAPFRLTFDHISNDWDRAYPDLKVTDVSVK